MVTFSEQCNTSIIIIIRYSSHFSLDDPIVWAILHDIMRIASIINVSFFWEVLRTYFPWRKQLIIWIFLQTDIEFVGNKAKGRISKRVFQENKERQIFRKTNISYPLIRTRHWRHSGVFIVNFIAHLVCFYC